MDHPRWVEKIGPTYFKLKDIGYSNENAALACRVDFKDILSDHTLAAIERSMRRYAPEYEAAVARAAAIEKVIQETIGGEPLGPPKRVPPPLASSEGSPLILDYEDGHLWNDPHIPFHLNELMDLSLERARVDGVRTLYFGGDTFDLAWASKWISWGKAGPSDLQGELDLCRRIFDEITKQFTKIVIIPGNHDGGRFQFLSGGTMGFKQLLQLMLGARLEDIEKTFIIGDYRWFTLKDSPWGDWRITHPKSARQVPLSLAEVIAQKEDCNVITAHQHYLGVKFDRYGRHIVCDGGHMQDEAITGYKRELDTTYSHWTPGYVELVDGWPNLITSAKLWRRGNLS